MSFSSLLTQEILHVSHSRFLCCDLSSFLFYFFNRFGDDIPGMEGLGTGEPLKDLHEDIALELLSFYLLQAIRGSWKLLKKTKASRSFEDPKNMGFQFDLLSKYVHAERQTLNETRQGTMFNESSCFVN